MDEKIDILKDIQNEIKRIFETPMGNDDIVLLMNVSIDIQKNICRIIKTHRNGTKKYYEKKLDE